MENMLPSAMVPGLVTIADKKGKTQNVFPIDAKELIASGEYTLVQNGSIEASRLNANPLMGQGRGNNDTVAVEVTGIAGALVLGADKESAEAIVASGDNADAVAKEPEDKPEPAPVAKVTAAKAPGTPTGEEKK